MPAIVSAAGANIFGAWGTTLVGFGVAAFQQLITTGVIVPQNATQFWASLLPIALGAVTKISNTPHA